MSGVLVLAGGAEFDERMAVADRAWLALLPEAPRLLVLPTANQERPEVAGANGARHFSGLGALSEPLMVRDAFDANDAGHIDALEAAAAVYMAGGNPRHLAATLQTVPLAAKATFGNRLRVESDGLRPVQASLLWEGMSRRWREGMALGGSSAGAMALCEAIYLQNTWTDGLGLLPGVVCLPHFNNRDNASLEDLRRAVVDRGFLGLGIDESTALYWWQGHWRVAGGGRVALLSSAGVESYRDGDLVEGLPQPLARART